MELTALLISALSLLIALASAIWAVSASRGANKHAKKASEKSDTANQLSAKANSIAQDSKRIAVDSRKIGEEALTLARRTEARESDTSNIHWEFDWEQPGTYTVTNRGDDEALDVRIIVDIDGEEVRKTVKSIPGGGSVQIECPQARATYLREVREYRAKKRDYAIRSRLGFSLPPDTLAYSYHFTHERIDWVSQSGKPGVHDKQYPVGLLGEFD
ncbi:hypothetical protein ACT3UD_16995 [Glutamicibacter sp. 287]|uniref:hypothetical protein n=1 Tax=unclassified Glutamicibacter TaxID=2627139 RepID=UPI004034A654